MSARHATAHEIGWMEWGREAFERVGKEDKLVLVDSGATSCHWRHVMDRVTYEAPGVVELVSARFVAVRVERDRLLDVDARLRREPARSAAELA